MSMSSSTPAPVIRPKTSILDKSLSRGKQEVSLTAFALLFSEMVQYCQTRSNTVPELQQKLHDLGFQAGLCQSNHELTDLRSCTIMRPNSDSLTHC